MHMELSNENSYRFIAVIVIAVDYFCAKHHHRCFIGSQTYIENLQFQLNLTKIFNYLI